MTKKAKPAKATRMKRKYTGRPMLGSEVRITRSIRIEPSVKAALESRYKTIQKFFDEMIQRELGMLSDVEVIAACSDKISVDDF